MVILAGVVNKVLEVKERGGCVELKDVVPGGGKVVAVGEGSHGRKGVIKDGMVARGDFACADVEDEGNQG